MIGDDGHFEDEPPGTAPGDAGAAALGHLQTAIVELVAAARAALEVVEKVVTDPDARRPLMDTAGALARAMADMGREAFYDAVRGSPGQPGEREPADGGDGEGPPRGPGSGRDVGVQRIRIQ